MNLASHVRLARGLMQRLMDPDGDGGVDPRNHPILRYGKLPTVSHAEVAMKTWWCFIGEPDPLHKWFFMSTQLN